MTGAHTRQPEARRRRQSHARNQLASYMTSSRICCRMGAQLTRGSHYETNWIPAPAGTRDAHRIPASRIRSGGGQAPQRASAALAAALACPTEPAPGRPAEQSGQRHRRQAWRARPDGPAGQASSAAAGQSHHLQRSASAGRRRTLATLHRPCAYRSAQDCGHSAPRSRR